jgi:Mn-dependent DtxR family transcriptional regulator
MRALMVVEKKMKKRETVAKAAERWANENVGNKQKYFKVTITRSGTRYLYWKHLSQLYFTDSYSLMFQGG